VTDDADGVRVDPHVKILDDAVVRRAKARGLDALVYAPHFTRLSEIRRRAERFSDDDLTIVPAREIFTGSWRDRRHVLAVGIDDPIPDFITLEAAMADLDRQDAAVLVPHPEFLTVSLDADQIRDYAAVIDAVEAYNPKHLPWDDRRARAIVRDLDVPAFASSYAHLRRTVGEVWTTIEVDTAAEAAIVSALQDGVARRVCHRDGLAHTLRRRLEFAHLGYENSWKKFDRVVRSGMEPTHPDHPAYDGRFDDANVYR
jgi:predicted metal-dependent phosphoesterase TrpH